MKKKNLGGVISDMSKKKIFFLMVPIMMKKLVA